MKIEQLKLQVSDSIGKVSAELITPDSMQAILVFSHGAGADMNHKFMKAVAKGLGDLGVGTLRFNFPFMENKKGRPDPPAVAEKAISAAIVYAANNFSNVPCFAGGKSFGGRMTSNFVSKNDSSLKGLVFFGFPLHAPGKPSIDRAEHLKAVKVPMLFLQGTRDSLADLKLLKGVLSKIKQADLTTFEGADHSFAIGKKDVIPELIVASSDWIHKKI